MGLAKLGILAPPWPIPRRAYAGFEIAIDGFCRAMAAKGVEVFLWSHPDSTCPVVRGGTDVEYRSKAGWHSAPVETRHVLAGYAWMESAGVELIHDHTFVGPLVGPTLTDTPIVTTAWLPLLPPRPEDTYPDLAAIFREMSRRVPILAVSESQASFAPDLVSGVIHLGTATDGIEVGAGGGDSAGPYVLFLGRMAPEKGVHVAIDVAARSGVRLKIAAKLEEPQELRYFEEAVEPRLRSANVELVGEPTLEEKTRLLQDAAALLNPIQWEEPFGLVMVEAMAVGTPVVSFARGSVPEIVEDGRTGAVCSTEDDLVAAVSAAASFSRERCRSRVEQHFTYELMADRHLAFYAEVLAGRDGSPG